MRTLFIHGHFDGKVFGNARIFMSFHISKSIIRIAIAAGRHIFFFVSVRFIRIFFGSQRVFTNSSQATFAREDLRIKFIHQQRNTNQAVQTNTTTLKGNDHEKHISSHI